MFLHQQQQSNGELRGKERVKMPEAATYRYRYCANMQHLDLLATMKLFIVIFLLIRYVTCQSPSEQSRKVLVELKEMAQVANCNTETHKEWNHAIAVRMAARKKQLGLAPDQCFKNLDKDVGGPSGTSSSFTASVSLRGLIGDLFKNESMNIKSFFDAACGDWVFMQHLDLTNIGYVGGDISDVTIAENARCFGKDNINFVHYDLTCHTPPSVDLMLMRDVLFHFKDHIALKILNNVMSSKAKYLLTTTFLTPNKDHVWERNRAYGETDHLRGVNSTIGFREVNLMDRPFCLPPPILKVSDSENIYTSLGQPSRYVGLWKLPVPVGQCPE